MGARQKTSGRIVSDWDNHPRESEKQAGYGFFQNKQKA